MFKRAKTSTKWLIGIAAGFVIMVLVGLIIGGGNEEERASAPSSSSSPEPSTSQSPSSDPTIPSVDPQAVSAESKAQLNNRLRGFLQAYFAREAGLSEQQHRERVLPYVTDRFMDQYYRFEPLPSDIESVEIEVGQHVFGHIEPPHDDGGPVSSLQTATVTYFEHHTDGSVRQFEGEQFTAWELTADGWELAGF